MRGTIDFSEFSGRDKFETQYLGLSVQVMLIDIKIKYLLFSLPSHPFSCPYAGRSPKKLLQYFFL